MKGPPPLTAATTYVPYFGGTHTHTHTHSHANTNVCLKSSVDRNSISKERMKEIEKSEEGRIKCILETGPINNNQTTMIIIMILTTTITIY